LLLSEHEPSYELTSRREKIEAVTGIKLAAKELEASDPKSARECINHAVGKIREMTRDPEKYKLLRRENKGYGFWRNVVAMRPVAITLSLIAAMLSLVLMAALHDTKLPVAALVISIATCAYWITIAKPSRVEDAAERYKDQFFNTLMSL
jgi:hypothetical protein